MNQPRNRFSALFLSCMAAIAITLGVTANAAQPSAPVADAGDARTVAIGDVVMLDASASTDVDGDRLKYRWTLQAPDGSAAALTAERLESGESDHLAVDTRFTAEQLGADASGHGFDAAIDDSAARPPTRRQRARRALLHALLNSNELIYVD